MNVSNAITTVTRRDQERPAWSRARHFAYIVSPVLVGLLAIVLQDAAPLGEKLIVAFQAVLYTTAVLTFLHLIRRTEEYQEPAHYERGTEFTEDGPHGRGHNDDGRMAA